jgi:hypothetical protein
MSVDIFIENHLDIFFYAFTWLLPQLFVILCKNLVMWAERDWIAQVEAFDSAKLCIF